MSPYLTLLVTMCIDNGYLIKVAVEIDSNEFKDDAYLEEDNKKIIQAHLEDMYHGPIVEVQEILGLVAV